MLFAGLTASALLAGCGSLVRTNLQVAGDLAAMQPNVDHVRYQSEDFIDPEHLDVYLTADAEHEDRVALWCDILLPNGADTGNTEVHGADRTYEPPLVCP